MRKFWFIILLVPALFLIGCGDSDELLTADAGDDFAIQIGQSPMFDGCGSEGNIENYQWTIIEAPAGMAGDSGKIIREVDSSCSFTLDAAMGVDEVGQWVIELEVRDAAGQTARDQVTVTVDE